MRLELAPSRMLAAALRAIGVLAAAGLFLTNLPRIPAALLGGACVIWGACLARRSLARAPLRLAFRSDGAVHLDDEAVDHARLDWQGALTLLRWRAGGRSVRHVIWPDVLDSAGRRELRLWTLAHRADASAAPVAP